jgi:hypothetical protein
MLAPRPPRRNFNFGPEPRRRPVSLRRILTWCATAVVVVSMVAYIGGPSERSPAGSAPRAGDCSVTPMPDRDGGFYGETQLFTLRAVARHMQPITRQLAITIQPDGSYALNLDGAAAASEVIWRTEDDFVRADPDAFVPLPPPLQGGWDVDIEPNMYSPGGFVAVVRSNC